LFSTGKKNNVCDMRRGVIPGRSCAPIPIAWREESPVSRSKQLSRIGQPSLLWIDDYQLGLELYRAMFESLGFRVYTASNGEEGLRIAATNPVDVVITDYEMPGMNGEAVAAALKTIKPGLPVVLFSGSTLVPLRARRVVDACCDKAASRTHLSATIQRVLHKKRTRFLQPPRPTRASDERHRTVA
jgi:CheY-like chemotaxis protein